MLKNLYKFFFPTNDDYEKRNSVKLEDEGKDLYEESVERATLLLEYTKDQYDYSLERMRRVEEKGLKLFASVSVITTALVLTLRFVGDEIIKSDLTCMSVLLLLTGGLTFIFLVFAWVFVFSAVTLKDLPALTTGEDADSFFLSYPRNETIWDTARKYHQAIQKLSEIHNLKALKFNKAVISMRCTALFFVSFVLLITIDNLWQEGGMFNKRKPLDDKQYSPTTTYVAQSSFVPAQQNDGTLRGTVTGKMSLPKRTEGPCLGVALESYRSLSEQRAKVKA